MGTTSVSNTSWKVDNATLHAGLCLRVGERERLITTAEFRRNVIIPCVLLECFDCRSQSTVCSQGPEPRVLDDWQGLMELPPSMQYEPLCRTTQHLKSRNRQSNDCQTNRLIPRRGRIFLRWVFLRLTIWIEERFLLCLFLFDPFPLPFVLGRILACTFVGLVRAKTTLLKTIIAF